MHSHGQLVIEQFVPDSLVLKFNIKSVSKEVFFDGSEIAGMLYTEHYDSLGNVVEQISFNNYMRRLSIRKQFDYDSVGNISLETYTHFSGKDSSVNINGFNYNDHGYINNNYFGKIEYKYNAFGQILEMTEKTAKSYDCRTEYIYNDKNKLTKTLYHSASRNPTRTEYFYDDQGRLLEKVKSYGDVNDPTSEYTTSYTYNSVGLVTEYSQIKTIDRIENKVDSRIYKFNYVFN